MSIMICKYEESWAGEKLYVATSWWYKSYNGACHACLTTTTTGNIHCDNMLHGIVMKSDTMTTYGVHDKLDLHICQWKIINVYCHVIICAYHDVQLGIHGWTDMLAELWQRHRSFHDRNIVYNRLAISHYLANSNRFLVIFSHYQIFLTKWCVCVACTHGHRCSASTNHVRRANNGCMQRRARQPSHLLRLQLGNLDALEEIWGIATCQVGNLHVPNGKIVIKYFLQFVYCQPVWPSPHIHVTAPIT